MKQRVIYGTLFALISVVLMVLCMETRLLFLATLSVLACVEMRSAQIKCGNVPMLSPPVVLSALSSLLFYLGWHEYVFPAFLIILMLTFCWMIRFNKPSVKDVYATLGMCVYPLSPIILMLYIATQTKLWAAVFLGAILPVIVSDTFALFGGKCFGKHKLAPLVSPNKTVEGLVCGLVAGTLTGFLAHYLLVWFDCALIPLWGTLIVAFAASLTGALGDLAASSVKRAAGIKDYGDLIPGHGGIMDRVDSELFAIPITYVIYILIM